MRAKWAGMGIVVTALIIVGLNCGHNDSPTSPSPSPSSSQLTAVPTAVTVAAGGTQSVVVTGGTPPYAIAASPASIASAQLINLDSVSTTLRITGITVASASTVVTVKDNTRANPKSVTIPITVR